MALKTDKGGSVSPVKRYIFKEDDVGMYHIEKAKGHFPPFERSGLLVGGGCEGKDIKSTLGWPGFLTNKVCHSCEAPGMRA